MQHNVKRYVPIYMKKAFAILFAAFIIVSGMQISVAKHICGGQVASIEWSFFGNKANCDMETKNTSCPSHNGIASNCCKNILTYLSIDNEYNKSAFLLNTVHKTIFQVFAVPVSVLLKFHNPSSIFYTDVSHIDLKIASKPELADICVFRI